MEKWLDNYRLPITVGLIIFLALGGVVLLFEQKRNESILNVNNNKALLSNQEKEIGLLKNEIDNLKKSNPPVQTEAASGQTQSQSTSQNNSNIININSASAEELDSLPGIGAVRANDIIKYRETNNGFKTIEDIKNVKGIGETTYNKLKDMITI